ncbi:hypothetical protein ILUMI_05822 [Ignelater luminosus]|uniref:CLIP domain-containing serine protease n=1 Tax=Ignelater luminosus TaxID=2038154 RepID=A0A8K0DBV8_IGNLU|nr:hypothetical protein ILUMI_05822 [Ignelater luminosus]
MYFLMMLSILLLVLISIIESHAETCITPNSETGKCISLFECPLLLSTISTQQKFYQDSVCGGTARNPMVCCGSLSTFISKQTPSTVIRNSLPTRQYCGLQHSDDYFHTVNGTVMSEFPWLALLIYHDQKHSMEIDLCRGSLINTKYVLTTGWCIDLSPNLVRLGEHHIFNKTDCLEDSYIYECSDETKDFGIEKLIQHPEFTFDKSTKALINNIGLIKLNESVMYSDYIRPICLPLSDTPKVRIGDVMFTTGWEWIVTFRNSTVDQEPSKKKAAVTVLAKEECETRYQRVGRIDESQMCGILEATERNNLKCDADKGGPVMYPRRHQWYQEGILTFEPHSCFGTYPRLFINVSYYMEWILETIKL